MRLDELAARIGGRIVAQPAGRVGLVRDVYAGDRMSDLLNHSGDGTLLVTQLAGPQLVRLAQLLDVPAICLANDVIPDTEVVRAALEHGTVVIVCPWGLYETCGRLYAAIGPGGPLSA